MSEAEALVSALGLIAHPAGGNFKEVYKSDKEVKITNQNIYYSGPRKAASGVYYLIPGGIPVDFHKHKSDCIFFWHKGCAVKIHLLRPDGSHVSSTLGDPLLHPGAQFQIPVTPGFWYAAEALDKAGFGLYSCVVVPGFEYADWTQGTRDELLRLFPQHKDLVHQFTKE